MSNKTYVGDTGTVITLDCGADITAAMSRKIKVRKPDMTSVEWTAVASGNNAIAFTSQAGTFDQAGDWSLQALVEMPSGKWLGSTALLTVYRPFD